MHPEKADVFSVLSSPIQVGAGSVLLPAGRKYLIHVHPHGNAGERAGEIVIVFKDGLAERIVHAGAGLPTGFGCKTA
jgi:hypothetical protein